jgi:hypothetical protein
MAPRLTLHCIDLPAHSSTLWEDTKCNPTCIWGLVKPNWQYSTSLSLGVSFSLGLARDRRIRSGGRSLLVTFSKDSARKLARMFPFVDNDLAIYDHVLDSL